MSARTDGLSALTAQALAFDDGASPTISLDSRLPTTTQINAAIPSLIASAISGPTG
jgi:hypothetical protein